MKQCMFQEGINLPSPEEKCTPPEMFSVVLNMY